MHKGQLYALLAAVLNAFVGVFSIGAFAGGISADGVAFYKCALSLMVLTIWVLINPKQRMAWSQFRRHIGKIALLAFCGIFLLYFFETKAYQYNDIANVVFTLLGASTITTFIGTQIILKKSHAMTAWFGLILAILGLCIFNFATRNQFIFNLGFIYSVLAGIGYGLFLVLNKKSPANFHGVAMLWWLLLFGCIFLFVPYVNSNLSIQIPALTSWIYIFMLGGASTIGGFYCTTKALSLASATTVQLCELNEPLFASFLAFLFYRQFPSYTDLLGGALILAAIYVSSRSHQSEREIEIIIN